MKELSFSQLAADVERARESLKSAGLAPGACVGLLGENCYEWIVWDLAILAEGCVAVCFPVEEFAARSIDDLGDAFGLSVLLVTKRTRKPGEHAWQAVINAEKPRPRYAPRPLANTRCTGACVAMIAAR